MKSKSAAAYQLRTLAADALHAARIRRHETRPACRALVVLFGGTEQ